MNAFRRPWILFLAGAVLTAAPDPDLFDGRLSAAAPQQEASGEPPAGGTEASPGAQGAEPQDGGSAASRDYESLGQVGGRPVASGASKEGAAEAPPPSGSAGANGAGGSSAGAGGTSAGGADAPTGTLAAGGAAGPEGAGQETPGGGGTAGSGEERNFENFGVGAAGPDSTVEVNRSKASLPAGPAISTGTAPKGAGTGGEPQQGASGGATSGASQTDRGTDVPAGL